MNEAVQHELEHQQKLIGAFGQLDRTLRKRVGYELNSPMEGSVTGLMVLPVLRALGWRSIAEEGHVETYCEYKSRVFQVDVAVLAADGLPRILVEVKRPGKDSGRADESAKRQLWGYAFEACRLHAPLAAVVLTNGRLWRIWRTDRATASINRTPTDVRIDAPETWPKLDALARENVLPGFAAVGDAVPSWPTKDDATEAWSDEEWERKGERFPKVYEHPSAKRRVVAGGWSTRVQKRYGEHHGGDIADVVAKHCEGCDRDERLGHNCDGSLPQSWKYRAR